jgi:hypothetical protein
MFCLQGKPDFFLKSENTLLISLFLLDPEFFISTVYGKKNPHQVWAAVAGTCLAFTPQKACSKWLAKIWKGIKKGWE